MLLKIPNFKPKYKLNFKVGYYRENKNIVDS